jgi:hypothetical protein
MPLCSSDSFLCGLQDQDQIAFLREQVAQVQQQQQDEIDNAVENSEHAKAMQEVSTQPPDTPLAG